MNIVNSAFILGMPKIIYTYLGLKQFLQSGWINWFQQIPMWKLQAAKQCEKGVHVAKSPKNINFPVQSVYEFDAKNWKIDNLP